MFETAELGQKISRSAYKKRLPVLRGALLDVQQRLRDAPFPVIVVFAGVDGAGKGETVNLLNAWMDPRWIVTRAFGKPSDEERERPEHWRFWRELPPAGRIGLFLNSWYSRPVLDRVYRRISRVEFEHQLRRLAEFEKTLADNGALIMKFWMHLDKPAQRARLRTLGKNPLTDWRVTSLQWKHWKLYDRFIGAAEQAIGTTSTAQAPWMIVEGRDELYRSLTVAESLEQAIAARLSRLPSSRRKAPPQARAAAKRTRPPGATVLSRLDMSKRIDKRTFERDLLKYQGLLNGLQRRAARRSVSTIVVMEGMDAAGKGGAIRRVTAALDARDYQVIPVGAPTDEERKHHYLWRFWRYLPRDGRVTIFDRSWYGRVLVERVEEFATPDEWLRAYAEINQFEDQLVDHGIVLLKYWIHITKDEQLRRFKARQQSRLKNWKMSDEDWRNRRNWRAYEQAVNDMIERTSTRYAPWTLVEGNDKSLRTDCRHADGVPAPVPGVLTPRRAPARIPSIVEAVAQLREDLAGTVEVRSAERGAGVDEHPAVPGVQHIDRCRPPVRERPAGHQVHGRMAAQRRTVLGWKARAVVEVRPAEPSARQQDIEAGAQRVPLIVVERESPFGRREVRQPAAHAANAVGVLVRIGHVHLSSMPRARRANGQLPSADQRAVDRQRQEHIRVADRIVVEEIGRARPEPVCVDRPAVYGYRHAGLPFLVALTRKRHEGDILGGHELEQRPRDRRQRRRLVEPAIEATHRPADLRDLHGGAGARAGRVLGDAPAKRRLPDATAQGKPRRRTEPALDERGKLVPRRREPRQEVPARPIREADAEQLRIALVEHVQAGLEVVSQRAPGNRHLASHVPGRPMVGRGDRRLVAVVVRRIPVDERRDRQQRARAERSHPREIDERVRLALPRRDACRAGLRVVRNLIDVVARRGHQAELVARSRVEDERT